MKQAKIFCVEDDEILARLIEWRLTKLGHRICGFSDNGTEAIKEIQRVQPDLALLDIELPGEIDGIEVGEYLSAKTKIPFIYLTSHTEDSYLGRAKKTRPKAFIGKPFTNDGLRFAIELAIPD